MGYYVVSDGTAKPYRVHMRNPSFATLQALETMCKGKLLADVVSVIGSIDIVLGEIDRYGCACARLRIELWTSWASMLRVYAAAHGLTATRHAVVEVGAEEILLRVDHRWLRFTTKQTSSDGTHQSSSA